MEKVKEINQLIVDFVMANPNCSSREIHQGIGESLFSFATLKRALKDLILKENLELIGQGKSTKYLIQKEYYLLASIQPSDYFKNEIDERTIKNNFDFSLIEQGLKNAKIFTSNEFQILTQLQDTFQKKTASLSTSTFNKEFERLAIDLSWKSSQIEGNTYSLLETEYLLKEKEQAIGKTKDEASMLLNHKAALDFLLENKDFVHPLRLSVIEDIHSLLIKDLPVKRNIRNWRVGISGTNYKPLDNEFQIREALESMCNLVNQKQNVFEKALLVLLLISYIQPFEDGNKRTARIVSNAILMNNQYCPLSFRTVNSLDYKMAMLIFYEQNNLSAFKKIFIDQFRFAVSTYF